jgi:hypothetical protein
LFEKLNLKHGVFVNLSTLILLKGFHFRQKNGILLYNLIKL